eukprot:351596-Chlamydomonas_euryale.AAC.13
MPRTGSAEGSEGEGCTDRVSRREEGRQFAAARPQQSRVARPLHTVAARAAEPGGVPRQAVGIRAGAGEGTPKAADRQAGRQGWRVGSYRPQRGCFCGPNPISLSFSRDCKKSRIAPPLDGSSALSRGPRAREAKWRGIRGRDGAGALGGARHARARRLPLQRVRRQRPAACRPQPPIRARWCFLKIRRLVLQTWQARGVAATAALWFVRRRGGAPADGPITSCPQASSLSEDHGPTFPPTACPRLLRGASASSERHPRRTAAAAAASAACGPL